jgi:hypothetical protein
MLKYCFVLPDCYIVFANVQSRFLWDSFCDLMFMLWLYVGLWVCNVLFLCSFPFFPWPALCGVLPARMTVGCIIFQVSLFKPISSIHLDLVIYLELVQTY